MLHLCERHRRKRGRSTENNRAKEVDSRHTDAKQLLLNANINSVGKKLLSFLRRRARTINVLTEHHLSGAQLSGLLAKLSRFGLALTAVEARAIGKGKGRTGGIAIAHDKTVPIAPNSAP